MNELRRDLLESGVEAQWFETPWGHARSLSVDELRAIRDGRRGITWAERWVITRDRYEERGASPGEAALMATADTLMERARTAHERVACPTCGAKVGDRCRRVNSATPLSRAPLKHSHEARLRADGIPKR